jgi:predicted transport protein
MMEYVAHRRIDMRTDQTVSEKWLQDRIINDPSLLGLGEVDVKDSERRQPAAGRLDLLLQDPETNTRYEVELQLGATDESHIIRTIEYWDSERRRYPQYEHVAVIVAEDITARFFNVISLLNGQIPIIAIHVQLLEVAQVRTLVFTRVLDHITLATDEEDEAAEPTDRTYWIAKGSQTTVSLADKLHELAERADPGIGLNYNKHYIGLAKQGVAKNFLIMRPRRQHLIAEFRLPFDEVRRDEQEALGFDVLPYDKKWNAYRFRLTAEDFDERAEALGQLAADAEQYYGTRIGPG